MAGNELPGVTGERSMFARTADAVPFAKPAVTVSVPLLAPSIPPRPAAEAIRARMRGRLVLPSHAAAGHRLAAVLSTEIDRGTAFLVVPVFLAVGAIIYFNLDREPEFWPLAGASTCFAAVVAATRSRPIIHYLAAVMLCCLLGICLGKAETWRAGTKMLGAEISTQVTGQVAAIEHMSSGRVRLTIDVATTARPQLRYAPERIRASARTLGQGIEAGSMITGLVRLLPPSGPVRPGSYDFSFESYFDGIGASGFFLREPTMAQAATEGPAIARLRAAVERFRNRIADRIRTRIGGAEGEIAAALVVGVRAGIPEDVNEALRRAGIYHIISISGLHAALAILGLGAYLFISGGEVAAQRSFVMLAVMLTAVLFDRAALSMRNLAISAIVVLAILPHEIMGPSFQMSFAATAAMVGAYAGWSEYKKSRPTAVHVNRTLPGRILHRLLLATAALAVTSIVAGGSTAIYAEWHFQQMPSLGLFTNLTAIPIVSTVVMPFAVLGTLAMPLGLDGPFFDVMGFGLTATIAIARWFSERSPIDAVGLIAPGAVIALTIALLIATIATTWLRLAAMPFAAAGLLMLGGQPRPDVLISEDTRLVALAMDNGGMAINRGRANEFTSDNWKRAFEADTLVAPDKPLQRRTEDPPVADKPIDPPIAMPEIGPAFACEGGLCLVQHFSGAIVAYALHADATQRACGLASVIVVDDATAEKTCSRRKTLVVTKRDLARRGSAAIFFSQSNADSPATPEGSKDAGNSAAMTEPTDGHSVPETASTAGSHTTGAFFTATIAYAVHRPYRPWHVQRQFSREARGLAPYQRVKKADAPAKPPTSEGAANDQ